MKTKSLSLLTSILFATATLTLAATNDLSSALQKGLFEEEANHNLDAAIAAYQSVATQFDKDRKLAATAIFRLGEVYRKQGKTNEASAQYERIVRDFADQTTLVELAQKNMPEKTGTNTAQQTFQGAVAKTGEDVEIQRIKAMIKDSPDLINALREGVAPLHTAAAKGQLKIAEFLLANDADVNRRHDQNKTPLYLAAENGHRAMVELLIAKGANVNGNDSGQTALYIASAQGFKAVVQALLENKADVNATSFGSTPLHKAVEKGHKVIAELLLEKGANINAKDNDERTPLLIAIRARNLEMAKFLIANKTDVNAGSKENWTPLHEAVVRGESSLVELLLQNGANTEAKILSKDQTGWTPLHFAAAQTSEKIVEMLLKSGANPNSANELGGTPLHYATGRREIAELLLAHKADVNAKTVQGETPLFWAVRGLKKPVVEFLLAHKANPNLTNEKGETPLSMAKGEKPAPLESIVRLPPGPVRSAADLAVLKEIQNLLIKYGADENQERRTQIAVTRDGAQRYPIFKKGTNSWNRFSLLEAFGAAFSPHSAVTGQLFAPWFPFPNLAKVKIHHLEASGEREIPVDLEAILKSGDCSKDIWLEWGDVIEFPEADHKIDASWYGFPKELLETLLKCLVRNVSISVKGETKIVKLEPSLNLVANPPAVDVKTGKPVELPQWGRPQGLYFWLNNAVNLSNLLRTSSDKTRVKVTRINPATKKSEEQIFNLEKLDSQNNLWLRDSDVVEIPEKP